MPSLIFLKRKWLIACDDFVFPCMVEAVVRLFLCVLLSTYVGIKYNDCSEIFDSCFMYAAIADLLLTTILSSAMTVISARGSVLEVDQRKCLPKLLFIKIITIFCDILITSFGTWLIVRERSSCKVEIIFIQITTFTGWFYCLVALCGIIVCHDTLGSPKYWNVIVAPSPLNFFKKVQYIWRLRLKFFCCCADISEENDLIYVEISTFLASFLNGIDLVPTDILAGIITLSQRHVLERRKYMLKHMPESLQYLESTVVPDWMTVRNALYFLRISKSTYGWMAFFNVYQPWNLCLLSSHAKCNVCCFKDTEKLDNCCYLNFAAVQRITGLKESDILYASFRNCIHEPAFYVAVDHAQKYVIVAVRGTRSFSDIVTDIDAETLPFPSEDVRMFRCHRGVLRSALFVQKRIEEHQILQTAFGENPSYTLTLTGHSLGGSVAAVLASLLRPNYPTLQCYTYGPMAAISAAGVPETLETTLSVVVGEDLSPRFCASSCLDLREQIIQSLKDCKDPKYKILLQACMFHVQKYFRTTVQKTSSSGHENIVFSNEDDQSDMRTAVTDDSKLYAPGRILYFERKKWNSPYWLTGLNLQNIIVNPHMIADHQPKKIQYYLTKFMKSINEDSQVV